MPEKKASIKNRLLKALPPLIVLAVVIVLFALYRSKEAPYETAPQGDVTPTRNTLYPLAETGLTVEPKESAARIIARAHNGEPAAIALVIAGYTHGIGGFPRSSHLARAWTGRQLLAGAPTAWSFSTLLSVSTAEVPEEFAPILSAHCEMAGGSSLAAHFARTEFFNLDNFCAALSKRPRLAGWRTSYEKALADFRNTAKTARNAMNLMRELSFRPATDAEKALLHDWACKTAPESLYFFASTRHDPEHGAPVLDMNALRSFTETQKASSALDTVTPGLTVNTSGTGNTNSADTTGNAGSEAASRNLPAPGALSDPATLTPESFFGELVAFAPRQEVLQARLPDDSAFNTILAAHCGSTEGALALASWYRTGSRSFPRSPELHAAWLYCAALGRSVKGMCRLSALLHEKGQYAEALAWAGLALEYEGRYSEEVLAPAREVSRALGLRPDAARIAADVKEIIPLLKSEMEQWRATTDKNNGIYPVLEWR